MCSMQLKSVGKLLVSPALLSVVFKSLCDLLHVSLPFILENLLPNKKMMPPKQGKSECA
jgi:hypothetical protein